MNNGLYAAYLGMRARQRTLDTIANNIANASSAGFKGDRLLYKSVEAAEVEALRAQQTGAPQTGTPGQTPGQTTATNATPGNQANAAQTTDQANVNQALANGNTHVLGVLTSGATDHSTGSINQTNRSLDAALTGEGFFVVQTPRGERYTRAGAFTLDRSGQLVTPNGDLVVGENGPLTLPPGEATISEDGSISVGGQTAGRLRIVRFADARAALAKEGSSLFVANSGARPIEATETRVVGGALEMANVNALTEMAAMMQNSREFDSLQRSMTLMMNDLGRKVANEIGRI
ncbi:MAG: flagellar hook-basal body protein [Pyrinomonadaceae bacterium]|nr:flagellar hook-basal body protein [Pyrinomonadaceae bacterium]